MQRDIVCLISGVDNILEYKQKVRLNSVATLDDIHKQLAQFLKCLGVTERVAVDLFDSETQTWGEFTAIESCPDKARLRIRRIPLYDPSPSRTVSREKAVRQKGDLRYINGKKRIWSGTRWNCEHDRRLSECKFCAANKEVSKNSNLQRQNSDILPMTNYQKRRRLGSYEQSCQLGRQTSLPEGRMLDKMERRPLQLSHTINDQPNDATWYGQPDVDCKSSDSPAPGASQLESSISSISGIENEKSEAPATSGPEEEEGEGWFWDLVDVLE